jgi:hypothetical protein
MAEVVVQYFDNENDAVAFVKLMRRDGCTTAITETASHFMALYKGGPKPVVMDIEGDGSSFAVMAFKGPILCQPPDSNA